MLGRPKKIASRRARSQEPCLASPAKATPAGPNRLHDIKLDGFRVMALPVRSCLLDGEVIVFDEAGLAVLRLVGALSCVEPRDRGG